MNSSSAKKLILTLAALAAMCVSAYAVTLPRMGAATADGRFLYVPDMARHLIRVIDANSLTGTFEVDIVSSDAPSVSSPLKQDVPVAGDPYAMAIDNTRHKLYVLVADPTPNTLIMAYSIQSDGKLVQEFMTYAYNNSSPRGMVLTPSGNYLYITDNYYSGGMRKIHRLAISFTGGNVSGIDDNGYIPVTGATNALYSIAISPDGSRMFVSNPSSTVGCVYMFNLPSENNPVAAGTIGNCPMASTLRFSPDGKLLYVRVNDGPNSGTNRDVRVFKVSDGSAVTDLKIPNPGNHVVGSDVSGGVPSGPNGYDDNTGNRDEDFVNYDAGLAIKPTGTPYVFYNHYMDNPTALNSDKSIDTNGRLGVSGDGMWHWNLKIRVHDPVNLASSWEGNAGRGFHSADSMIYTSRNRLWAFYSNGGYVQSTPMLGPDWVSHYMVTSNEATIIWSPVDWAQKYQVQYYKVISGPSTVQTVEVTSPTAYITLEAPSSPLTQMSTYDVQVRAISPIGEQSQWTPNDWVPPDSFYTLEQVWTALGGVDVYSTGTAEAQILFGPIVSQTVLSVPFATRYDLWYRLLGSTNWTKIPGVAAGEQGPSGNTHVSTTNPPTLYYELTGLTSGATYELIMRSVDSTSGTSEWSATATFEMNAQSNGPWCGVYNITSNEAVVNWGKVANATGYQIMYKATTEGTWHVATADVVSGVQPQYNTSDTNPNMLLTNLNSLTTYEVKVDALLYDIGTNTTTEGTFSKSAIFYTLERPWVDFINSATDEVCVLWGPEISTTSVPVPLSNHYEMLYRKYSDTTWTTYTVPPQPTVLNNNAFADGTTETLSATLEFPQKNVTYEVIMRTVDNTGGVSLWSDTREVLSIRGPWWISADLIGTHEARVFWDDTPRTIDPAAVYTFSYGTDTNATNGGGSVVSPSTFTGTNEIRMLSGLQSYTTYYTKVQVTYSNGLTSIWAKGKFYTDAFPSGPLWSTAYNITSREATVNWGRVIGADGYTISLRPIIGGPTVTVTTDAAYGDYPQVPANSDINPHYRVTVNYGLTPMTTYEVVVSAFRTVGAIKQISAISSPESIYTLERPWVDFIDSATNEVFVLWGPEVSAGLVPIPLSNHYEMLYKKYNDASWTSYTVPPQHTVLNNSAFADGTTETLSATLEFPQKNVTYEVIMRTVDNTGGTSLWSATQEVIAIRGPWWISADLIGTNEARIFWDDTPRTSIDASAVYEFSYGTDTNATNGGGNVVSPSTFTGTNEIRMLTGLTPYTTYYIKVRVRYSNGLTSIWAKKSFYTDPFAMGPVFSSVYNITSNEATIDWGEVLGADGYVITCRPIMGGASIIVPVSGVHPAIPANSDLNPHYRVTYNFGLSPMATYEVKVQAVRTVGSVVQGSASSESENFYTLERPWVAFANPSTKEVYVLWGPEISQSVVPIPYSNHYEMLYRKFGDPAWTSYTVPPQPTVLNNSAFANGTTETLSATLEFPTKNVSYEVMMRTVDNTGGVSLWSATMDVTAISAPLWVDVFNVTWEGATAICDPAPKQSSPASFVRYEFSYGTDVAATNLGIVPSTITTKEIGPLTAFTTYYIKVRAIYNIGGNTVISNWCDPKQFYTLQGPIWISNYNTTTSETQFVWQGVTGIASYEVAYGISTEPMSWTSWGPTPNNDSITDTQNNGGPVQPLQERKWYRSVVRSHFGLFASSWSATNEFYTIPAPNLISTGATLTTVSLQWNRIFMGSGGWCASYEVSVGTTPDATGLVRFMTTEAQTILSVPSQLPLANTTYYVKVRARDDAGGGWSAWSTPYPSLSIEATDKAKIYSVDVSSGFRGTTIKIGGQNFGVTAGTVSIGAVTAQPAYWNNNEVAISVPPTALAGVNSITLITHDGKIAIHVPVPFTFNVLNGGYVMDDYEGGTWQYTVEATGGTVTQVIQNSNPMSPLPSDGRSNYVSVVANSSPFGMLGGITPYGDMPTENGYDISTCKAIRVWIKGDITNAPNTVATFELVESNTATGNDPASADRSEVWIYSVPISLNSTTWQPVTILLNTVGSAKFTRDLTRWQGNNTLDLNRIKAYQIVTNGSAKYYVDQMVAMTAEASASFTLYAGSNGNINWLPMPFMDTGLKTTTDLAASIASVIPAGSLQAWVDQIEVQVWDATAQTYTSYMCMWDGTNWVDNGINTNLVVGDMYKVAVPMAANGLTWTISGTTPPLGSAEYTLKSASNGNYNWITTPADMTDLANTTDLAKAMGAKIPGLSAWNDMLEVHTWDGANQVETPYLLLWDGTTWEDLGNNTSVRVPGAYIVAVPQKADGVLWP